MAVAIAFAVTVATIAMSGYILNFNGNPLLFFFIGANISKLHAVYKVIFLAYFISCLMSSTHR